MKKKLNRKPAYKKGGESWVSDKMANLPMYQMGDITPQTPTYQNWVQQATNTNAFGFPNNVNKNYGRSVTATADTYTQPSKIFAKPTIQSVYQGQKTTKTQPVKVINSVKTAPAKAPTPSVRTSPATEQTKTDYNFSGYVSPNIGYTQSPLTLQSQENKLDPNSLNYGETWASNNLLPQMGNNGFSYNPNAVGNLNEAPSDILKQNQEQYSSYNTKSADTTEPQQFFNPYGGVDIESRLSYGANQLGKGNTAQGILGLASGALGIARTGIGAYAAGNREKYVMNEYDDRVNKAMTPRTMALGEGGGMIDFMQNGGYNYAPTGDRKINSMDAKKINEETGIPFTRDFAQSYFSQQTPPPQVQIPPQVPIKNTNVLDITSDGLFTDRKVWRNQKPEWYVGKQEAIEGTDYDRIPYKQWENYKMTPEYNTFENRNKDTRLAEYQEGGETGQDQIMQIIQMYAQIAQQDPQAIMEQLQQLSPEEQQQAIQQMAQAIQQPQEEQQFQKGGEFAKKLTGEYTTPLDENDPTINAEVEKNEYLQSPDGEITKALGETHEKNGTKVNLEGGTRIVSDHLKLGGANAKHYKENFDLEVKANDTYAKVLDRFTKKSGLQKIVDEQEKVIEQLKKSEESAQGSSVSESTNSLNKMFLSEKLSELEQEKAPLLEARKSLMDDVFQRQEASKPVEETEQEQYEKGGEVPKYQGAGSFSDDNLENFYRQSRGLGYTGKKQIGDIQQWMSKNYPEEVVNYFTKSGQPLTAKHVDLIKSNSRDVFVKTGISPDKASADYTSEEKLVLQNALGERANKEFYLQGFTDNKWDWRAPVMGVSPLASMVINKQQISAPQLPNFYREPEKSPITEDTEVAKIKDQQEDTRKGLNLMMLPNQAPMMPDSLEGALKVTRRYDRVNPMQFSPEQQVGAIRGQESQAMQQINQLPESQRAGALANLSAITQENLAKVYSDVNRTNLAADNQAQQFNAQTQAQEENARVTDLQSYENKIMRAKATTDADRRGYYNQLQAIDLANYNSINNVNLLNQMYENYGYNGNSVEQTQGAPKWNSSQATANGIPVTNTKKKTTKKRFGGKI